MVLRFAVVGTSAVPGGTAFAHGITNTGLATGAGAIPTEWAFNYNGAPPAASLPLYLTAVTSVSITVAAGTSLAAGASVDVFAALNHSVIR